MVLYYLNDVLHCLIGLIIVSFLIWLLIKTHLYFSKNIDNYYQYIMETISLQPRFILPLLSFPGVIFE